MTASSSSSTAWKADHEGQHPDLHKMCCINAENGERIIPNSKPVKIDNECFEGEVLLLIRTPDVDQPADSPPSLPMAKHVSDYMQGRQRRFEFQFRIKFKKPPTGPIFLGCEVPQPVKLGRITKGLTSILLAMIRRINSGFHYSWGVDKKTTKEDLESGNYENTHLSFPVEASMDRIVITKPGETPPELGSELPETDASVKRRRKQGAGCVDWNTTDTYTMCLWSAYVDWLQWKCVNVAGVRPFPLGSVLGTQPIYLCVYEIKDIANEDYKKERPAHSRKRLSVYSRMEFSHIEKTSGGMSEQLGNHVVVEDDNLRSSYLFEKRQSQYEHDPDVDNLTLGEEISLASSSFSSFADEKKTDEN